ncbi:MAG TPA: hypothetical protein PKN61_15690 [Acidobacteriota bacterium]|nr:hypothetical protein [Acidobacteriota bacterium]HNU01041.1 hypothetical protein [Acidobacteriota bacterium]HOB52625.1 hypothetical protein [Acidobacteriota bacterium]HQM63504.1 hypothetical protein [Acidobacteriota bacterium]
MRSIWFFVGLMLLVMGAIVTAAGAWQLARPPAAPKVLAQYHPSLWWGLVMMVFGGVFLWAGRRRTDA